MIKNFPLVFFIAAAGLFAQPEPPGIFGPVTEHLKAGDFAPDLRFEALLHSPSGAPWNQGNLSAHLSVLVLLPDTRDNPNRVTQWNAMVEKFGEKVQFVWITGEEEPTIRPWLAEHPVSGWMLNDPTSETGRAYGLEQPTVVLIGSDHRILGFEDGIFPREEVLNAALEGRITHTAPKVPATLAEALAQAKAAETSNTVYLPAEPPRMSRPVDHKPDFAPSRTLHISPAKDQFNGGDFASDDYLSLQGFTLKAAMQRVTGVSPSRMELPESLDTKTRYDFALVLPAPDDREAIHKLMQREIERQFHIFSAHENRKRDVYVMTVSEKKKPPAAPESQFGGSSSMGYSVDTVDDLGQDVDPSNKKPPTINEIDDIDTSGTVDEFCSMLEAVLDRPLLNETGLTGNFEFHVKQAEPPPGELPPKDFVQRLRDELGLIVTEEQRNVDTLVFAMTTQ